MVKKGSTLPRYDWDDKHDVCRQLYVEEKKSIPEIVKYFANHFNVSESELPSAKVFHRQFTEKWGFPRRRAPLDAETEKALADTMVDMWQRNVQLKDIFQALLDQGHEMNHYDFMKLRKKYGLNRRGDYAYAPLNSHGKRSEPADADEDEEHEGDVSLDCNDAVVSDALQPDTGLQPLSIVQSGSGAAPLSVEEEARRAQRMAELQLVSDQQLHTRKRRRRIRGFGHLPPDAAGSQPRYGSETSLDECKAFLNLDNEMYLDIRQGFDAICREMNIDRKKTSLEDGRWQTSKDRLIRDNKHLSATMNPLQPDMESKILALDLICADVTKRLRDSRKQMTIAGANNLLGLNPAESKDLRRSFYQILEADHYTTRLACGDEHWRELREQWHSGNPLLAQVFAEADPHKMKAANLLCRDASKRYNDDKTRLDPTRKQYQRQYYGPGPGAATHRGRASKPNSGESETALLTPKKKTLAQTAAQPAPISLAPPQPSMADFDPALDPALASAAPPFQAPTSTAIPAYFRLSPNSVIVGEHPQLWLGRLDWPNMFSLQVAATSKVNGGAQLKQVHGIVVNLDNSQDNYQIDTDDELSVYLDAAGPKPTFLVTLEGGYA